MYCEPSHPDYGSNQHNGNKHLFLNQGQCIQQRMPALLQTSSLSLPVSMNTTSYFKFTATATRTTGLLFLLAFILYGVGINLLTSFLNTHELLPLHSDSLFLVQVGFLLVVMNSVVVVGIAALLFPLLERYNKPVAIGYLSARILEALLLLIGAMSVLSVAGKTTESTLTAPMNPLYYETLLIIAGSANTWAYQTAMFVLGVGSVGFCYVLFRARLLPPALSLLGLVGYVILAAGALCEFLGLPVGLVPSIPGGLFELGFALWTLANPSALRPLPSLPATNTLTNAAQ